MNSLVPFPDKFDEGPDELVPLLPGDVSNLLVLLLHQSRDPPVVGLASVVLVQPAVGSAKTIKN